MMDDIMNGDTAEKTFDKPIYDARQQFYKILQLLMYNKSKSSVELTLSLRIKDLIIGFINHTRYLFEFFEYVQPFISSTNKKSLQERLNSVNTELVKWYSQNIPEANKVAVHHYFDKKLRDISCDMMEACKHMLLPFKDDDDGDFSDEEFMKGSDI